MCFVKSRVGEIDIFGVHFLLAQAQAFAEISNLSKAIEPIAPQGVHGFSTDRKNVWTGPLFLVICPAPRRDLSNQLQRERLAVGKLNGAFAGFVVRQLIGKHLHSLRARVKADVPFEGRELDQVTALPIGGHTPGDLFLGLRDAAFNGVIDLAQIRLHLFRLAEDVFLDRLRRFPTVMILLFSAK